MRINNEKNQPEGDDKPVSPSGNALKIVSKLKPQAVSVIKKTKNNVREWCDTVVKEERYGPHLSKVVYYIDRSTDYMTNNKSDENRDEVMHFTRPSIVFGIWTIIIVFGFFGLWAAFAPLDSAAVARGTIVNDSNKKTIQHLEGGIIKEILVREGDTVTAGQPLIRLSETAAKARQDTLVSQLRASLALEARLIAERDSRETIEFDKDLLDNQNNPEVAKIIDSQTRLFNARKEEINGKVGILNQRTAQFNDQITGLTAQEAATRSQMALIKDEVNTVSILLKSGNANRPRLLALQRREAELRGIQGQYLSEVAKTKQSITENDLQIINTRNEMLNNVMKELRETQVTLADLREKVKASSDIQERLEIVSPQPGIVNGLMYHTVGGVISPGTPIMDIIPQNDDLVIDAQVSPQDIDVVHAGLDARVRLTAFRARTTPIIEGKVVNVSADKFTDKATNQSYYVARVKINPDMLHKLEGVKLYPGMPADVLIITGSRTFLHYLMGPITDTMRHSFREE